MTVKPVPDGYRTVTPWIISRDTAGLIDYLKEAFDAEEIARVVGEDGRIGHAEVEMERRLGDPKWIEAMAYVQSADFFPRTAESGDEPLAVGDRASPSQ